MSLDIPTLEQQLKDLAANAATLDTTIKQRNQEAQELARQQQVLAAELLRLEGARSYHNMVVEQVTIKLKDLLNALSPAAQ